MAAQYFIDTSSPVVRRLLRHQEQAKKAVLRQRGRMAAEVIMATELTGRVVNGIVVLDQPGTLAEGTEVRIRPVQKASEGEDTGSSLSEMLLSFAGTVEGLPEDMALNHDHYLYGVPKKSER